MAAGPVEAANLIHTVLSVEAPPRSSKDVLTEIIVLQGWYQGATAQDKAETWLSRFVNRLKFIAEEGKETGGYISFAFNSSGLDFVQGYCFCEPQDSSEVQASKRRRAQTINIYQHFRTLTDRQFEQLSGKVLELLGVQSAHVSRRSSDQGVDFYGKVQLGDMLKPSLLDAGAEKHIHVWLVGQSKHYPLTRVSTGEIRELVGSIEFARAKVFAGSRDPLENLTARLCDPIIYLFFTSGKFTRDSKSLLDASGVLSFNGLQLGQFLADHGIGIDEDVFVAARFNRWLSSTA